MSERTSSLLPEKRAYPSPQEIYPQNSHNIAENSISAEKIGRKTFGVVLVSVGLFSVVWGINEAIQGLSNPKHSIASGAIVACLGWIIANKGLDIIKD